MVQLATEVYPNATLRDQLAMNHWTQKTFAKLAICRCDNGDGVVSVGGEDSSEGRLVVTIIKSRFHNPFEKSDQRQI